MADNAINRQSLTTSLAQRYENAPSILSGGGDAKQAGIPSLASTDAVNIGDNEFRPMQYPAGVANDTRSVQKFAWEKRGGATALPTVKYAPSGRLP